MGLELLLCFLQQKLSTLSKVQSTVAGLNKDSLESTMKLFFSGQTSGLLSALERIVSDCGDPS